MTAIELAALVISAAALTINAALTITLVRTGRPARSGPPVLDETVTPSSQTYPLGADDLVVPLNVLGAGPRAAWEYQRRPRPAAEPTNLRADLGMLDVERQRQRATRDANLVSVVRRRDDSTCRYCGREVLWGGSRRASSGVLVHIGPPRPAALTSDDFVVGCARCEALSSRDRPALRSEPSLGEGLNQGLIRFKCDVEPIMDPDVQLAASGQGQRDPGAHDVVALEVNRAGVLVGGQVGIDGPELLLDQVPNSIETASAGRDFEAATGVVREDGHKNSPSLDGSSSPSVGAGPVGEVPPVSLTGPNTTGQVAE